MALNSRSSDLLLKALLLAKALRQSSDAAGAAVSPATGLTCKMAPIDVPSDEDHIAVTTE